MSEKQQRNFERRVTGAALELREAAAQPTKIVGYAAVFNSVAHGEVIQPGAFSKSIQEGVDVRGYWQHRSEMPLARVSNGTLVLEEDEKGLRVEIAPNPETSWGKDALASVARGDVTGMSFGFYIRESSEVVTDGVRVTVLEGVDLVEVSPVSEPWYGATEAGVREAPGDTDGTGHERHETALRDRLRRVRVLVARVRAAGFGSGKELATKGTKGT